MIKAFFEITPAQSVEIKNLASRTGDGSSIDDPAHTLLSPYTGISLMRHGWAKIPRTDGMVPITLDHVTVVAMEYCFGDDPSMTRDGNRAEMRGFFERERDSTRTYGFHSLQEKRAHYTRILSIFDMVQDTMGPQPDRGYAHTPKLNRFVPAWDFVAGDTLRWRSAYNHALELSCVYVADLVSEIEVKHGDPRAFETVTTKSFDDDIVMPGKATIRDIEFIRGLRPERQIWENEKKRDLALKTARLSWCGAGMVDTPTDLAM